MQIQVDGYAVQRRQQLLLIRLYTEIFQMLKIRFTHKLVGPGKEQHDPRSGTESTDSSGKGNKKDGQQMKTYSSTGNDGLLLANQGTITFKVNSRTRTCHNFYAYLQDVIDVIIHHLKGIWLLYVRTSVY
jgi:hypothetical protein